MANANTARKDPVEAFAVEVKIALIKKGWSMTTLARELGLKRNTVSLAVNRGLFLPTRCRIAAKLGLSKPQ